VAIAVHESLALHSSVTVGQRPTPLCGSNMDRVIAVCVTLKSTDRSVFLNQTRDSKAVNHHRIQQMSLFNMATSQRTQFYWEREYRPIPVIYSYNHW